MSSTRNQEVSHPRIFHYYARHLVHPSGVTDAIEHWLSASQALTGESVIFAARPKYGREAPPEVRTIRHLGWGRKTWIPIGLMREVRSSDIVVLHEGWVLSNLAAALFVRLRKGRFVVMPHGVYERGIVEGQRDPIGIRRRAEAWMLRSAAAVHVFYRGEEAVVQAVAPEVKDFIVVPNGAPVSNP